jgi:NADH-quinone oxidoreductase subunit C
MSLSHDLIIGKLKSHFGESEIKHHQEPLYKELEVEVPSNKLVEALRFLYDDQELQFRFLTTMFAVHYPDDHGREFQLVYLLTNLFENTQFRLKTYLPQALPEIETATTVFSAANWMEREQYDFFGIIFHGHPNLKRILNAENMDYFPMRKEYPLEELTRADKDDGMFGR